MKMISWNVNGLRACLGKGCLDLVESEQPYIMALQETKLQPEQVNFDLPGYSMYFNSAEKKGYSGTALLLKEKPLRVTFGMGIEEHDREGRVITAEYPGFFFVTVYTPNSQDGLRRLDYRMTWEEAFLGYLKGLDGQKPVIVCGDLNVAHEEIDIKNPKSNRMNAGFTDQEREKMTILLQNGFADTFRRLYPEARDRYSWWSYRFHARENNAGWRIDYFLVSERLMEKVKDSLILSDVFGSDQCPVALLTEAI